MPEWVRVKDPATGHEVTVTAEQAEMAGVRPLDKKEALTPHGEPRRAVYKRDIEEAAAAAKKGA